MRFGDLPALEDGTLGETFGSTMMTWGCRAFPTCRPLPSISSELVV
jgi:hypothetical protein